MGGIFNCLQQDIDIRDFPSIFSTKPLQVTFVLLMVNVQLSCQKTKYQSIADTMRYVVSYSILLKSIGFMQTT
jgi:hypothetical protein